MGIKRLVNNVLTEALVAPAVIAPPYIELSNANDVVAAKTLLEVVLSNMAQAMVVVDANLKVIAFNHQFCTMFELAQGEVRTGMPFTDAIRLWAGRCGHDETAMKLVLSDLTCREPFVDERRQVLPGRGEIWYQVFHNPLPSGGMVRTFTDVTPYKHGERQLRQQYDWLAQIYDSLTDLLFLALLREDAVLECVAVNRAMGDFFDFLPEAASGKLMSELVPCWEESCPLVHRQGVTAGVVQRYEATFYDRHQQPRIFEINLAPIFDEQGSCYMVSGMGRDITERKRVEAELRYSEERFRFMVEAAPFPLVVTRLQDHQLIYMNQRAGQLLEIEPQTAVGRIATSFYEERDKRLQLAEEVKRTRFVRDREIRLKKESGTLFWALWSGSLVEYHGEEVLLVAINDISERKAMETQLTRLATTDFLTGISNRRHFLEKLQQMLHHAYCYQQPLALLLFDLDHFKKVNDTYGHPFGDIVLQETVTVVRQALPQDAILGRLGGEEFAVGLPGRGLAAALPIAEALRQAVAAHAFRQPAQPPVYITVSVGVAWRQSLSDSVEILVGRADNALYVAKHSGRDCVRYME